MSIISSAAVTVVDTASANVLVISNKHSVDITAFILMWLSSCVQHALLLLLTAVVVDHKKHASSFGHN